MTIQMHRRSLYIPVLHIDTNLINARQKLESINQLERWHENDVILINMSSTAHSEAQADGSELRTKKANTHIFTVTPAVEDDDPEYRRVESALFPEGAVSENQRNDIRIVCEAIKYAAILVTGDGASRSQPGGILGNRDKLRGSPTILSPDEAIAFVRKKICERDEFNLRVHREIGGELPLWTGKDDA
jgi:hypothetical protein